MGMSDGNEVHAYEIEVGGTSWWMVQDVDGGCVQGPSFYRTEDEAKQAALAVILSFARPASVENETPWEWDWTTIEHKPQPISYTKVDESVEEQGDTIVRTTKRTEVQECDLCKRPVRWTGTSAEDSPTGKTIPGPWVHVE